MSAPERVNVLIVGAGISGIGAAIRLRQAGFDDLVILEKAGAVGGTWRDNTYPGCACDVPSALYSYSFAQKPDWSRVFAPQPEIEAYVRRTAERFGVLQLVRYGHAVESARWDESALHWVIQTATRVFHARFVVSCAGYLHEPHIPEIDGLSTFPGRVFHSSRWDHAHDLEGLRVAVVGTGASAIQFVPEIQPKVRQLYLFQRSPQWVLPKLDAKIGLLTRNVLSIPAARNLMRRTLHRQLEEFGGAFRHPSHMKRMQGIALRHLHRAVQDPELRRKLTPSYVLGCKRILLSNDYYPAVARPNVEVLPAAVHSIQGRTVVAGTGERREVDTLILGTGFHVSDPPIARHIYGTSGRSMAELWKGSPEAFRGTTIAGFPNSFLILGPNLAIGHNSAFIVIEAQLQYVVDALRTIRRQGITRFEVRRDAQAAYNRRIQRGLEGTVWNAGGCASYYIDANGKNSVAFPWSTDRMKRLLSRFDIENYHVRAASHRAPRTISEVTTHV